MKEKKTYTVLLLIFSGLLLAVLIILAESAAAAQNGTGGGLLRHISSRLWPGGAPAASISASAFDAGQEPVPAATPPSDPVSVLAEARLDIPLIYQNPELPNGCEATSLAMALNYIGYSAGKEELAYEYIPRQDFEYRNYRLYGGDPAKVYPGDPATNMGFYCLPQVLADGANAYFAEQASRYLAKDITGAGEEVLTDCLSRGIPVVIWLTLDLSRPQQNSELAWTFSENGREYVPYTNMHVAVLTGFDSGYFYLNDPLGSLVRVPREQLIDCYAALGNMAMVITAE